MYLMTAQEKIHTQLMLQLEHYHANKKKKEIKNILILKEFYYSEFNSKVMNDIIDCIKFRIKEYKIIFQIFQIFKLPHEILNIPLAFYQTNNKYIGYLPDLRVQYIKCKEKDNKAKYEMRQVKEQYDAADLYATFTFEKLQNFCRKLKNGK